MRVWKTQQHTERAADAVRRIFYRIKLQGVEKSVKKAHNKDMLFFTIAHLSKFKKSEVEIEAVPVILTCGTLYPRRPSVFINILEILSNCWGVK